MSVSTKQSEGAVTSSEPHSKPHPRDRDYVVIALILGVLTAIEIAFYFLEDDLGMGLVIGSLIFLMIIKFIIVGAYFMHLKFDNPIFMRVFILGLAMAIILYVAALTSLEFWSSSA